MKRPSLDWFMTGMRYDFGFRGVSVFEKIVISSMFQRRTQEFKVFKEKVFKLHADAVSVFQENLKSHKNPKTTDMTLIRQQ